MPSFAARAQRVAPENGSPPPTPLGGAGPDTEAAIESGLEYLAGTQLADGRWSLEGHGTDVILRSDTAATGLSVLAFQGAGYTHREHRYADHVADGIDWLIDHQSADGNLYVPMDAVSDRNAMFYSHGIAALALSEAYGMTRDVRVGRAAQAALDYIAATQHRRYGGWRYTPQVSTDTSVSGWMMMALKSGELSGLEVAPEVYDGIRRWLSYARGGDDNDLYRYNPFARDTPAQRHGRLPTPTMTAVGMLINMYAGADRDDEDMRGGAAYLLTHPPRVGTPDRSRYDTYYWYYATQVMFHMGGESWNRWNRSLNPILLDSQIDSGPRAGSWSGTAPTDDRWARHAGPLYVTAMNLLSLEIYYRHLPIYEETGR